MTGEKTNECAHFCECGASYFYEYETPVGKITIVEKNSAVTHIFLSDKNRFSETVSSETSKAVSGNLSEKTDLLKNSQCFETDLLKKASDELFEYFDGNRKDFDIPLNPEVSDFQKKVLKCLCDIPYGETRSYKDVATAAGNPKASRAVGMANNRNPIMIMIPCHRVIGSNGNLTGYAGGLDVKEKLLKLESGNVQKELNEFDLKPFSAKSKNVTPPSFNLMNGLRSRLNELSEPSYRKFSSSLLPGTKNILGIRLPNLRKLAKEVVDPKSVFNKNSGIDSANVPFDFLEQFFRQFEYDSGSLSFEEIMVAGFVIGMMKGSVSEKIAYIRKFVPLIDNWSVCDSFCVTLKLSDDDRKMFLPVIREYAHSDSEFESRFAAVMLLDHYIVSEYFDDSLEILGMIRSDAYYSKMGVAWALSIFFIHFPEKTMKFLIENSPANKKCECPLDAETFNKSLQKIVESRCVDRETKDVIRKMKVY